MAAQIKFVQGAEAPPSGQALLGTVGLQVTASDGSGDGPVTSYTWTMLDVPPGSAVSTGLMGNTTAVLFTPDVPGGYLVKLQTNVLGVITTDTRAVLVPYDTDYNRVIPPYDSPGSALNVAGQTRGWSKYLEPYFQLLNRLRDVSPVEPAEGQALVWDAAQKRYKPGAGGGGGGGAETITAECDPTLQIKRFVLITGYGALPYVNLADCRYDYALPAVGFVVSKPTTTTCIVQLTGVVDVSGLGLTPGLEVYVGQDGVPAQNLYTFDDLTYAQRVGVTHSPTEMNLSGDLMVTQLRNIFY